MYLDAIMTTAAVPFFAPNSPLQTQLQHSAPHLLAKYANVKLTPVAVSFT